LLSKYKSKIPKIWFHEIKGERDVATRKEIEIASKLPKRRANIFLESRSFIRHSLGSLFELNPLEIPIVANPGEPPELPKGMGYVSFSHSRDAIVLVWHEKNIGIDIERTDRNFNYEILAKKYFFKSSNIRKLNKELILNQWCAIEAAIKWDHGKLAEDLKEWQYFKNDKILFHKKKKLNLKFSQVKYYQWTICLAYQGVSQYSPNILCTSKMF